MKIFTLYYDCWQFTLILCFYWGSNFIVLSWWIMQKNNTMKHLDIWLSQMYYLQTSYNWVRRIALIDSKFFFNNFSYFIAHQSIYSDTLCKLLKIKLSIYCLGKHKTFGCLGSNKFYCNLISNQTRVIYFNWNVCNRFIR